MSTDFATALADNTDQLQKLINKNAGKLVKLPAGTLNVSSLIIPENTQLIIGPTTVLKGIQVSTAKPLLRLSSGVVLSGTGVLDGNRTVRQSGTGIQINSAKNIRISGVRIRNIAEQGIQVVACQKVLITGVTVMGCGAKGVDQYQGINLVISQNVQVTGCSVSDAMHGIQWWGDDTNGYCENIQITNNRVKRVTGGIWGNRGRNVTVSNNTIDTCQDVGVDFEHSFNSTAIGNTVRNCKNYGLATFFGSERITFLRNRVYQSAAYGHGIGLCGEGTSKQISFVGGTVNTKGINSLGVITVGANVAENVLIQGMRITAEGEQGMAIRIIDNNRFQIINNPLLAGASSTGVSLEGSSNSLVEGNTIAHLGKDTSKVGEKGGIFVYFRSKEYPSQHNTIQKNKIAGYNTGINDDCWGDVNSQNKFLSNTSPNLFHRTANGQWGGQAAQNRTATQATMPLKSVQ